jgi:hypothetical protein
MLPFVLLLPIGFLIAVLLEDGEVFLLAFEWINTSLRDIDDGDSPVSGTSLPSVHGW